jgi:hypothetical protein
VAPDAAAHDFVRRIDAAGRAARAQGSVDPTVFVILDGENAWEHFEGQGRPFLRALYRALTTHPDIQTVTMREACATATARLSRIRAGSWINSDFYIWAGHADDRRAWAQLARARLRLEAVPATHPGLARAWDALLVAEGSDWFWWYGDDHSSEHDAAFDELFRCHVRNVYLALGETPPHDLWASNISTSLAVTPSAPWLQLTPTIRRRRLELLRMARRGLVRDAGSRRGHAPGFSSSAAAAGVPVCIWERLVVAVGRARRRPRPGRGRIPDGVVPRHARTVRAVPVAGWTTCRLR